MSAVDLPPGTVFAHRYQVERRLNSGGMGAVYVVSHLRTRATMALKVMHPAIVADAGLRARFVQEAQVASQIDSPYVVAVTDADVDEATGVPFLVMELLRGRELGELLRERGRFSPAEVVQWLGQAARALDKAHSLGIVHRDLKPENLFLVVREDEEPRIKILDFGIAKILNSAAAAQSTQGGGTPLFMAPEQTSKSRQIGPWTDIFALGLMAYAFLVGRSYWEADSVGELFGELLAPTREAPTLRAARHGAQLPEAFDAWFQQCCHADPTLRFPRASIAVQALQVVFAGVAGPPLPISTLPQTAGPPVLSTTVPWQQTQLMSAGTPSTAPSGSSRRVVVAAASVLAIGGIGAAVWLAREPIPSMASTQSSTTPTSEVPTAPVSGKSKAGAETSTSVAAIAQPSASPSTAPTPTMKPTSAAPPPNTAFEYGWTCGPLGTLNAGGTCDCPVGYKNVGVAGKSKCAKDATTTAGDTFDQSAARTALADVPYKDCGGGGVGQVVVVFDTSGSVLSSTVTSGDYDSATKSCISGRFKSPKVSAFSGTPQAVTWKITL